MDGSGRQALAETVSRVRARIQQLRERGDSVTEQDTKRILIEPVLAALGWRLEELDDDIQALGSPNDITAMSSVPQWIAPLPTNGPMSPRSAASRVSCIEKFEWLPLTPLTLTAST